MLKGVFSSYSANDLNSTKAERPPADEAFNALIEFFVYVVHAWAAMLYAFMRRGFGRHFFSHRGMSCVLVLSFWACVSTRPEEAFPLTLMMAIFVALTFYHRHKARSGLDGNIQHSRYTGWPLVCDVLPVSERFAKICIEPGVVYMFGLGASWLNLSLGIFIMIGAFACLLDWIIMARRDYRRAKALHDAERTQEGMMETYDRHFKPRRQR